jgi:O-antigen ligase
VGLPAGLLFLAAGLWYLRPALGPWPLLLVGLAWLLRLVQTGSLFPRSAFDGPLALFLLSAAAGAAISIDSAAVWGSTFFVYVGAVVVYYAVLLTPERVRLASRRIEPLRLLLLLLPSVAAAYFLLTTDWQAWQEKLGWLGPALDLLASLRQPAPGHLLHPNMAGGLLAALLPLQIGALRWRRSPGWLRLAGLLLIGLTLLALLASGSRGAWLALLAAAGLWLTWRASGALLQRAGRPAAGRRRELAQLAMLLALLTAGLLAGLAWLATPTGQRLLVAGDQSRLTLWIDTLHLLGDTPLTGLGFEAFQMAYVSYGLLLHVGFQPHSHSLPLEIWLRQGMLGLLALAWIAAVVLRLRHSPSRWRPWALASLAVIALHGLVDIPLYGGRGLMLAPIPLALLARGPLGQPVLLPRRANLALAAALALLLAGALLAFTPAGRATVQTNLGALAQTRAELALYRWPEWPLQDELRRTGAVDLTPIVARYQAALAENPANAAANRRLGQIELSLGQYTAARQHLEAAYAAAPGQRATRQLLAESYAIEGELEQAAALLRTVDTSLNQMEARIWWYNHIGETQRAELLRTVNGER